ncbi:rhamnulokinase [Salsuginibacillus kocurii]|uniref:rhamnulokinase n=1 Tax=Salsuginibacillus kocurii TaxID=427078 RepID=UPI000368CFCC|nr:rhamnulokinase family protein [Salsuginibacillus kocurii]
MSVLAFDIGAGSGRAVIGDTSDNKMAIKEVHRFSNDPVQANGHLHWDILRLFFEIKEGIRKAHHGGHQIEAVSIDTWAVDFGLLSKNGELLGNPYHYRDHHTDGVMEHVHESIISREDIFYRTGIQFLPFNTIYQLRALKEADSILLQEADTLLLIPDLIRYFLTGNKVSEFTNATTTQLFNPKTMTWDEELLNKIGVSIDLFPEVVQPGTKVGTLTDEICEELDVPPLPVMTTGEHDTASAVAGVPALDPQFAYLSCGTWSLIGTETKEAVINEATLAQNFTNEGGVENTFRLLKNIMGLWILEECRSEWKTEEDVSHNILLAEAAQAEAFRSLIDPDDRVFLNPVSMLEQIKEFCQETGQPVPRTKGEFVRCILESLALKYRFVFERTEELAQHEMHGLHMVGGGIKNEMLCQFTANALGKPVWAGPTEGSALGNLSVSLMGMGKIESLSEARLRILKSTDMKYYFPEDEKSWQKAYEWFCYDAPFALLSTTPK